MQDKTKRSLLPAMLFQLCLLLPCLQAFAQAPCDPPPSGVYEGRATGGTVWGSPASGYTTDSDLAVALVHAGLVPSGVKGKILITSLDRKSLFIGSTAYGVTTLSYPDSWCAMRLEKPVPVDVEACKAELPASGEYSGAAGSASVWGSTHSGYTTDSAIPELAVHAGLLRPGEKARLIFTSLGRQDYFYGHDANGVTSKEYTNPWCAMKVTREVVPDPQPKPDPNDPCIQSLPAKATYTGQISGRAVWGSPTSGYTTDSSVSDLAVHAGLLRVGESGILEFKSLGAHDQFIGTNANGVSTLNYSSVWCAMQVARVGGSQPKPQLQASHSPEPLIAGQPFSLSWSSSNASNIALVCTAQGSGFSTNNPNLGQVSGTLNMTASSAWVGYPSSCTWTATGPGGSTSVQDVLTTKAATPPSQPLPTINVNYSSMPLTAGQRFTLSWSSSNTTRITRQCTASGTGFTSNGEMTAPSGSLDTTAQASWVGYPSTCVWTAYGPGGSTSMTEVRTTEVENSTAEVITYFHNDAAGTPQLATDAKGNVLWQDQRLPFGAPLHNQNTSSLGYTGKPYDPDTGLLYLGARYYDPLLGRFLSMDPVEFDEGNLHSFNRYAYANNNPYRYVDPDGRNPLLVTGLAGQTTATAAAGAAQFQAQNYQQPLAAINDPLPQDTFERRSNRWYKQLDRLLSKADQPGPLAYQYALLARSDGYYPNLRDPGKVDVFLKKGEIWKIGTSINPDGRYSPTYLDSMNVEMKTETTGTTWQVLVQEKVRLIGYAIENGNFPPGNCKCN